VNEYTRNIFLSKTINFLIMLFLNIIYSFFIFAFVMNLLINLKCIILYVIYGII